VVKAILFGDFPPCPTGASTVNYHIAKVLANFDVDLHVHTHIAGMPYECYIYGIKVRGGRVGRFSFESLVKDLDVIRPDVAILSGTWFLWRDVVASCSYHGIPMIGYIVTEGFVDRKYADCLNKLDRIFTPSHHAHRYLSKVIRKPMEVLPHGIDTGLFMSYREPEDVVFYPARYGDERKQTKRVIEAFKKVRERVGAKLLLPGLVNPPIEGVEGLWNSYAYSFKVKTPDFQGVVDVYNRAKLVLSLGEAEGFSLPIIEGWSCSRPVLALDAPPHDEIITDRDFLVKVKERVMKTITVIMGGERVHPTYVANVVDENDLAEKMIYVLENEGLRTEACAKYRERVLDKYDYLKNYVRFYDEVCRLV